MLNNPLENNTFEFELENSASFNVIFLFFFRKIFNLLNLKKHGQQDFVTRIFKNLDL